MRAINLLKKFYRFRDFVRGAFITTFQNTSPTELVKKILLCSHDISRRGIKQTACETFSCLKLVYVVRIQQIDLVALCQLYMVFEVISF